MLRVLKIKGTGEANAFPDQIRIMFTIVSQNMNYEQVMSELNQRTEILKADIMASGFKREDIKTTQFNVNTEYDYVNGQRIFKGYVAKHEMKLVFPFNQTRLNQLLTRLSTSASRAEFQVFFEVSDEEGVKQVVLKDAVRNARLNAEAIAEAASVKLGKILNIQYDWQEARIQPAFELKQMAVMSGTVDVNPDDVKVTDSVFIEWEIEDVL
jgi:uncharacterized protein